jgi:hypothetical protein
VEFFAAAVGVGDAGEPAPVVVAVFCDAPAGVFLFDELALWVEAVVGAARGALAAGETAFALEVPCLPTDELVSDDCAAVFGGLGWG